MAKKIMIQGTMSNAGKSLLTAGLCRIFKQDGYKVAPFKSQNMALNSYITEDGLEMGRAQVVQAQACGIEPSVFMNPILLKPVTDMGSQVIVNGEVQGNMDAASYFKYKKQLIPDILHAVKKLEEEYEIIVIEGAGSPAEINLKKDDIVNMGLAKMLKAPVLLAGDIDRGGVFAQLAGTLLLLEEEEKAIIKGLIINKFRGDKMILNPGIEMLKQYTDKPVLGVVPYMDVDIEEEDSLSERLNQTENKALIDIAVIRFPKISNYTDFYALELIENCSVRYVSSAAELKYPDLIILPGTKSTISDLEWIRQNGLEGAILKAAGRNTLIFGICGGYQMLGNWLDDPDSAEGGGSVRGMELLPIKTRFSKEKTRTRVNGKTGTLSSVFQVLSDTQIEGYEIHMGITKQDTKEKHTFSKIRDGLVWKEEGMCVNNICGTYVHGIFDTEQMQSNMKKLLYAKKGLDPLEESRESLYNYRERQYEKLAKQLRNSINMEAVYQILKNGAEG